MTVNIRVSSDIWILMTHLLVSLNFLKNNVFTSMTVLKIYGRVLLNEEVEIYKIPSTWTSVSLSQVLNGKPLSSTFK